MESSGDKLESALEGILPLDNNLQLNSEDLEETASTNIFKEQQDALSFQDASFSDKNKDFQEDSIEPQNKPKSKRRRITFDDYQSQNQDRLTEKNKRTRYQTKKEESDKDVVELNYSPIYEDDQKEPKQIFKIKDEFESRMIARAKYFVRQQIQEAKEKTKAELARKLKDIKELIKNYEMQNPNF